jgi:hypothetical protein
MLPFSWFQGAELQGLPSWGKRLQPFSVQQSYLTVVQPQLVIDVGMLQWLEQDEFALVAALGANYQLLVRFGR